MSNHDQTAAIKALNDLVATLRDAEEGYAKAAKGVHNTHLSNRLVDLSAERGRFADEIAQTVQALGATPSQDAHFGGILHKGWVDLETRIRPKSEIEIVRECIAGEGETLKHFDRAISLEMPSEARIVVDRHLQTIRTELSDLEDLTEKGKVQHA